MEDDGKAVIWRHTRNLKGKPYSVNSQLSRKLDEEKRRLVPNYKEARAHNIKVRWIGEKLLVKDQMTEVRKDSVKDINADTTEKALSMKVRRAPPKIYNGSSFQGSCVAITQTDDAISALHAIYSDSRTAHAKHNIYAYRIQAQDTATIIEHYEDDGDYGAGRRLLELLREKKITNQFICVTSWQGGKQLGSVRFQYTLEAAKNVLDTV